MVEEQAVFEQLTLNDFKMWKSTVLKTFNNYSITMSNIRRNLRILMMVMLFPWLLISELIQLMFLNILKISKVFLKILKEQLVIFYLVGFFYPKFV